MALDLHTSVLRLSIPAVAIFGILGLVAYNDKAILTEQHYGQTMRTIFLTFTRNIHV